MTVAENREKCVVAINRVGVLQAVRDGYFDDIGNAGVQVELKQFKVKDQTKMVIS